MSAATGSSGKAELGLDWALCTQASIAQELSWQKMVRKFLRSIHAEGLLGAYGLYRLEARDQQIVRENFEIRGVAFYDVSAEAGLIDWFRSTKISLRQEGLCSRKSLGGYQHFFLLKTSRARIIVFFLIKAPPSHHLDLMVLFMQSSNRWMVRLEKSQDLAHRDDLTNLYNFRYLESSIDAEIRRCQRFEKPFTLLFIDIDRFKPINDRYGHSVGSQILKELASVICGDLREVDSVFRYGGDEFVVLLVESDEYIGAFTAKRIRKNIESYRFHIEGEAEISVTASIGLASFPLHAKTKKDLLICADKSMYAGKKGGKNRVCSLYSETGEVNLKREVLT